MDQMRLRLLAATSCLLLAAVLAGCGEPAATGSTQDGTDTTPAPGSGGTAGPEMQDGKYVVHTSATSFSPADLTVPAGATVVWTIDQGMHDVTEGETGSDAKWSSDDNGGSKLYVGQTYERTITEPGVVHYRCVMHEQAGMVGTITVT